VTSAKVLPEPNDGKVAGPATVVLTAKDNAAGVATTEYSLDGGEFQAYDGPFTVSALGDHTIAYRSTSGGGAVEPDKEISFTVVAHDAPLTTAKVLPEPVDGNVVGPATVVLSATDNGGGVAGTEYSLDGGEFQAYDGPFTVSAFGDHTVDYRSTNGDGVVEETKQIGFSVIAHAAPVTTASILPAPIGGKVVGPATVVLAAKDEGGGVAGTEFSLDGGEFQAYDGPLSIATLGDHTIEYRSSNRDGVVEATKQVAFTVVAPPPPTQLPVVTPPPTKPVCAEPHLAVTVVHPQVRGKDGVTLRRGKAYRFTGRLTCGGAGAPAGTALSLTTVRNGRTTPRPGVTVGDGGRIDSLLRFSRNVAVVFGFAADGLSAQAAVHVVIELR
jgi:hypothetical protein